MAITNKRRRSSLSTASANSQDVHKKFRAWAESQSVEIHDVEAKQLPGRGLGLLATRRIKEDSRILFVPERAIFKPNFTLLKQSGLERASPQAKLALSSLAHFGPSKSVGAVWRDTWPTEQDLQSCMPIYWQETVPDKSLSSMNAALRRQKSDFQRDLLTCEATLRKLGFDESQFKYHWMIVNSRSFHWGPPHGGTGYMVMCPFIDYLNHGPTGSGCKVLQHKDGYEVLAERTYKAGEEILVSYGAHSNDKLLVHYGFILSYKTAYPSIDDEVRIDEEIIGILSAATRDQLQHLGYLGPFALVPCTDSNGTTGGWEPCFKTQIAVRASFQTYNEWEYFVENGVDLASDSSQEVSSRLAAALKTRLQRDDGGIIVNTPPPHERSVTISTSDNTVTGSPRDLVVSRWKQMRLNIASYVQSVELTTGKT